VDVYAWGPLLTLFASPSPTPGTGSFSDARQPVNLPFSSSVAHFLFFSKRCQQQLFLFDGLVEIFADGSPPVVDWALILLCFDFFGFPSVLATNLTRFFFPRAGCSDTGLSSPWGQPAHLPQHYPGSEPPTFFPQVPATCIFRVRSNTTAIPFVGLFLVPGSRGHTVLLFLMLIWGVRLVGSDSELQPPFF